jgi:mannose-6-phosphate isomerase-like protein (cupin superfamily)
MGLASYDRRPAFLPTWDFGQVVGPVAGQPSGWIARGCADVAPPKAHPGPARLRDHRRRAFLPSSLEPELGDARRDARPGHRPRAHRREPDGLAPGNESFVYHAHLHEEEWVYILSGRATVESDGALHEVAAGDFIAFPTPSEPHILRNTSAEDVVYLTGGERSSFDVADFPRHGKRMVRIGERATVYELAGGAAFPLPEIEPF